MRRRPARASDTRREERKDMDSTVFCSNAKAFRGFEVQAPEHARMRARVDKRCEREDPKLRSVYAAKCQLSIDVCRKNAVFLRTLRRAFRRGFGSLRSPRD